MDACVLGVVVVISMSITWELVRNANSYHYKSRQEETMELMDMFMV